MKRAFDILASLVGILVLSPVLLAVAIAVKLTSDAPLFYRGVRVGLDGKTFRIFKFSTMVANAESIGGPSTALNDPRLTRIGKFLRKHKLDELPQLFNVLRGEMSIVGPRPQVERYTKLYDQEQQVILTVRPGLTDYASVHFINLDEILGDENVDEKYQREIEPLKNRLRIRYVKEQSFMTDMKIIAMTFLRMLHIRHSWNTKR